MTQNLLLTSVSRPSDEALQAAILCFADDAENTDGEAVMNAGLTIVGEACSLLDEGKSEEEAVVALGEHGLSVACATPFVEKARDILQSNEKLKVVVIPQEQGNAPKLLIAAIAIVFVLAYMLIGVN